MASLCEALPCVKVRSTSPAVLLSEHEATPAIQTVSPRKARGLVRKANHVSLSTAIGCIRLSRAVALRTLRGHRAPVRLMCLDLAGITGVCLMA